MSASDEMSVEVVQVVEEDPRRAILEFLDSMDPDTLEREALKKLSWGETRTVTAVVIDVMREIARGVS